MYALLRTLTVRQLILEQAPPLAAAWIVAELFYKFGSFTLETLAFLATWLAADALVQVGGRAMAGVLGRRGQRPA